VRAGLAVVSRTVLWQWQVSKSQVAPVLSAATSWCLDSIYNDLSQLHVQGLRLPAALVGYLAHDEAWRQSFRFGIVDASGRY
jgi:hypothetical protein